MNLQQKLTALFLSLTIPPMFVVGSIVYVQARTILIREALIRLEALAAIKEAEINEYIAQGKEDFGVITLDLSDLGETGEVMLGRHTETGDAVFIAPHRFPQNPLVPREKSDVPIIQALLGHELLMTEGIDYRGVPVLAATRYIPSKDWGIVVKMDTEEVFRDLASLRKSLFIIFALGFTFSGIFIYIGTRTIVVPIQNLTRAAKRIAEGDLEEHIQTRQTHNDDEIQTLTKSFITMQRKLRELVGTLEQKVRERTVSLRTAIAKEEAMLSSIGEGIIAVDKQGFIIAMSKATERILGWKFPEIRKKNYFDVIPMTDASGNTMEREVRPLYLALTRGVTMTIVCTFLNKNGTNVPVLNTVAPILFQGHIIGAIANFRDMTEHRELERIRTEFVSLASHQLRTPFTGMRLALEELSRENSTLSPHHREIVLHAERYAENMAETMRTMLSVARLEAGTLIPIPTEVSVKSVLADVGRMHARESELKKITIEIRCPPDLTWNTDPVLLKEMLSNLISNSVKYSPQGGTIRMEASVKEDHLRLTVRDSGCGIPADEQERVFSRFFRASNAKHLRTDGTGLGLYLVRSTAKLLGGDVTFTSRENEGTLFTIDLSELPSTIPS